MLDPATTSLLRAVLDEVCVHISSNDTGARAHVASKILKQPAEATRRPSGSSKSHVRLSRRRQRCGDSRERRVDVNFQVTVLKILVSYPDGFAVMADIKRDMAILATSGSDWTDRTKRLAAHVPELDIFSQKLVERLTGGWRITGKGRKVLEFMEARSRRPEPLTEEAPSQSTAPSVLVLRPTEQMVSRRNERRQRRRAAGERIAGGIQ